MSALGEPGVHGGGDAPARGLSPLGGLWRERYGASPLHLLAHVAALALVAWALLRILDVRAAGTTLIWLAGAVVDHDYVHLPFYSLLDRVGRVGLRGPALNYVRVPLGLSGLLLLVFFPLICGRSDAVQTGASGVDSQGYLERWLLACALLCLVSGALYLLRARRSPGGSST